MSTSSTDSAGTRGIVGAHRRRRAAVAVSALCLVLGACTSDPSTADPVASAQPAAPSSSAAPAGPSSSASSGADSPASDTPSAAPSSDTSSPPGDALIVTITETSGDVTPNGQKINARVGQQVVLEVTSDTDDEIHAHTGGDGYELEVAAGVPTTGTFTLESAGSFEVESHELNKVIVILNAR